MSYVAHNLKHAIHLTCGWASYPEGRSSCHDRYKKEVDGLTIMLANSRHGTDSGGRLPRDCAPYHAAVLGRLEGKKGRRREGGGLAERSNDKRRRRMSTLAAMLRATTPSFLHNRNRWAAAGQSVREGREDTFPGNAHRSMHFHYFD